MKRDARTLVILSWRISAGKYCHRIDSQCCFFHFILACEVYFSYSFRERFSHSDQWNVRTLFGYTNNDAFTSKFTSKNSYINLPALSFSSSKTKNETFYSEARVNITHECIYIINIISYEHNGMYFHTFFFQRSRLAFLSHPLNSSSILSMFFLMCISLHYARYVLVGLLAHITLRWINSLHGESISAVPRSQPVQQDPLT